MSRWCTFSNGHLSTASGVNGLANGSINGKPNGINGFRSVNVPEFKATGGRGVTVTTLTNGVNLMMGMVATGVAHEANGDYDDMIESESEEYYSQAMLSDYYWSNVPINNNNNKLQDKKKKKK